MDGIGLSFQLVSFQDHFSFLLFIIYIYRKKMHIFLIVFLFFYQIFGGMVFIFFGTKKFAKLFSDFPKKKIF